MTNKYKFAFDMGLNSMYAKYLPKKALPRKINMAITSKCNAKCGMCNWWTKKPEHLDTHRIEDFFVRMFHWMGSSVFIQLTGGEPMMHPHIYNIIKMAKSFDFYVKMATNGGLLNTRASDALIATGLDYINFSIDSCSPNIHNEIRGVEGLWETAYNAIDYISRNSDMRIGISMVILSDNIKDLAFHVHALSQLPIDRIILQPVRPIDIPLSEWTNSEYWIKDREVLLSNFEELAIEAKENKKLMNSGEDLWRMFKYFIEPTTAINWGSCIRGNDTIDVDHEGFVYLCNEFKPICTVEALDTLWRWGGYSDSIRDQMLKCQKVCTSNCKAKLSIKSEFKRFKLLLGRLSK